MGNSPEICRRHYAALVPETMHDTVEFKPLPVAENQAPRAETMQLMMKLLAQLDAQGLEGIATSPAGKADGE